MKKCNFHIDTSHTSTYYENWYEDLPVELSDEEFEALCAAQKKWMSSGEWHEHMKSYPDADEEYFLKKYCPDILCEVRKTLLEYAPEIWDERIIPNLNQADIYVPDEVWDANELIVFE